MAVALYCFAYFFELRSQSVGEAFFWLRVEYLGLATIPSLWLLFVVQYTDREPRPVLPFVIALFIIPVITFVVVLTNDAHHLYYSSLDLIIRDGLSTTVIGRGPWFWVHTAFFNACLLAAFGLLIQSLLNAGKYHRQRYLVLMLGSLLPWTGSVVYLAGLIPSNIDPGPFAIAGAGAVFFWDLHRNRLFDLVPIARAKVFEAISDGIVVLDGEDRVLDVNRSGMQLLGVNATAIGSSAGSLLPGLQESLEESPPGTGETVEYPISTPLGNRWLEVRLSRIEDKMGVSRGRLLVIHDITNRKEAEADRQAAFEMETSLRHRIEREIDRRIQFTRALVHEMKNPLTSLMLSNGILEEKLEEETLKRLAANVGRSATTLSNRVDELLDIAKGEMGTLALDLEPVDLEKLLLEAADITAMMAANRRQTFRTVLPPHLPCMKADPKRLAQVLQNLLDNAIKFTPEKGTVTLRAEVEDSHLKIEVEDTGLGINAEDLELVFDLYYRGPATTGRTAGMGIGLALSKTLVELHRGRIWVTSEEGRGSTFSILLPLNGQTDRQPDTESGR